MTEETIAKLNDVNWEFYQTVGEFFDNSRQYSWEGWDTMVDHITSSSIESVLDVGCGNGRFYGFVTERIPSVKEYVGIDGNDYLLEQARKRFIEKQSIFINNDILSLDYTNYQQAADLTVVFGVMHHMPASKKRIELVQNLATTLKNGGFLCLSFWNFLDNGRIANKQADWDVVGVHSNEVEKGDYLLTWDRGVTAYRYCHYFTNEEIDTIIQRSGLTEVARYKAEGKEHNLNTYLILQKR